MIIYFGIGSNLGNRDANLQQALQLLDERVGERIACSNIYRSAAQGFESENEFANIVAVYRTEHSPEKLLALTQQMEREMGRTEKSVHGEYHDRMIDIDLLMGEEAGEPVVRNTAELMMPHPRMKERDFVMVPLSELKTEM